MGKKSQMVRLQVRAITTEEAQQLKTALLFQEGCIDVFIDASNNVEAYFEASGLTQAMLPQGCTLFRAPVFRPGDRGVFEHSIPGGVCSGDPLQVLHLTYVRGLGYRYQVIDERTQAQVWMDEQVARRVAQ